MSEPPLILKQPDFNSFLFKCRQVWVLSQKNIRLYFRRGPVLMFGLLFPFFIALTWIMGREIADVRIFIGITTMAIFFTASAISPVILPWETREKGLERQITSPVNLSIIVWGIIVASTLFSLGIGLIVILLLGLFVEITFTSFLLIIGFIIACILISLIGSLIGVLVSAPPTDQLPDIMTLANLIKFPLIFISGIFVPLTELSSTSAIVAWFSPITPFVDAIAFCVGEPGVLPFSLNLGILLGWCIVMYLFSRIAHNRTFGKRFSH